MRTALIVSVLLNIGLAVFLFLPRAIRVEQLKELRLDTANGNLLLTVEDQRKRDVKLSLSPHEAIILDNKLREMFAMIQSEAAKHNVL